MRPVILLVIFQLGYGLKCYNFSVKDIHQSPVKNTSVDICNSSKAMCYKAVLNLKADETRYTYVIYGCDEDSQICTFAQVTSGECRQNAGVNVCCCSDSLFSANLKDHPNKQTRNVTCSPFTTMCIKMVTDISGAQTTNYGCDNGGTCSILSINAGKCKSNNGVTTCCCASNLCNAATSLGYLFVIVLSTILMIMN